MSARILVVDDIETNRRLLEARLMAEYFDVLMAQDGPSCLDIARDEKPDVILLDIMMPGMDGFETCSQLKESPEVSHIPVVMVTARGEEVDRVVGFEVGADDYVVKPFSIRELLLRVRAVLRRSVTDSTSSDDRILCFGRLRIDSAAHRVWVEEDEIVLTALEFRLLLTFIDRKDRVQSREQLLDDVWGVHAGITTRTVDVHIKRLRTKLGKAGHYVGTVRGVGYRFSLPTEPAV